MKTVIIYAHPYDKSFNHAILQQCKELLSKKKVEYEIIDLYKDNFNPVYTAEELSLYSKGEVIDPLAKKYQKFLLKANKLIIITPIWWNDVPAILKGFFDKVCTTGFSHIYTNTGVKGKLSHIQKCTIYTTSNSPTWYFRFLGSNSIKKTLINGTLKQIGIDRAVWKNIGNIKTSDKKRYLENIKERDEL